MLNWIELQTQLQQYAEQQTQVQSSLRECTRDLLECMRAHESNWQDWKERAQAESGELIPDFDESPLKAFDVPAARFPMTVLSSDGSQVFPNSHEVASLALISASRIRIDYGMPQRIPVLDCDATTVVPDAFHEWLDGEQRIPFRDIVSDQRTLYEIATLANLAEQAHADSCEAIALCDGSLITWRIASRNDQPYEKRFVSDYVEQLSRFQQKAVPVAGYISGSGNRELVKLVEFIRKQTGGDIQTVSVTDIMLMKTILSPGQRSVVFRSQSQVMKQYGDQAIAYVYLNVGEEIAKVEFPVWLEGDAFDQTLAHCVHQSDIGGGYPVVLAEAHEHAVVRGPDRQTFYMLVEQALMQEGITPRLSSKQLRKNASLL